MTYRWYDTYKQAVLQTDWSKIEENIQSAKTAITERQSQLSSDHGGTLEERQAIADALNALDVLQTEVGSWSRRRSDGAA